ncbi:serine protease inhibitor 42Dd-like isoform X1 [Drosophila serrata]|uniref:serine protease inhibitor 42Dd-like isoform X1 n=1 Tax=Drosophila serrata TaxID=7274 RepID=UPI000A1D2686|nr:serine protease inhibitor 42Dd-like isoform X1 [Drosophila serrata]
MKYLSLILFATSVAGLFTEDFYRLLAKDNAQKNLIASPLSVEIAMAMAYMGAEGETADELRTALKLPMDKKQVASKYRKLLSDLQGREKDVILDLANRIYINNEYSLVPEYNEVLRNSFQAEAVPISVSNAKNAADIVNEWVSNQTRGKINEVVTPADMRPDLRALLLNAIYFKGQWKYKFNKELSEQKDFKISDTERIPVTMMTMRGTFKADYLYDLDAKVIELPYRNSSLSMLIFLPNKVDGLSELEDKIIGFSRPLYERSVYVELPKFKIEFEEELNGYLKRLGIRKAFSDSANFEGLVQKSQIHIDKVLQKAFVEVNEEGAEAAAVTVVKFIIPLSVNSRPEEILMKFKADHPFAYIIRDENTVYFQGHVVNPK